MEIESFTFGRCIQQFKHHAFLHVPRHRIIAPWCWCVREYFFTRVDHRLLARNAHASSELNAPVCLLKRLFFFFGLVFFFYIFFRWKINVVHFFFLALCMCRILMNILYKVGDDDRLPNVLPFTGRRRSGPIQAMGNGKTYLVQRKPSINLPPTLKTDCSNRVYLHDQRRSCAVARIE